MGDPACHTRQQTDRTSSVASISAGQTGFDIPDCSPLARFSLAFDWEGQVFANH